MKRVNCSGLASTLCCASIVASAILVGCKKYETSVDNNESTLRAEEPSAQSPNYEFNSFGKIERYYLTRPAVAITRPAVATGDFDGDGAVDIVVINSHDYSITLIRNNMPQKNTNNLESAFERR